MNFVKQIPKKTTVEQLFMNTDGRVNISPNPRAFMKGL